ncbi:MAG: site-specific integrase [Alistipes sp.]|nr:site-specific integrase [Alistipes sp.]
MTTFKFHYRPPANGGTPYGTLFVRIIHGRRYRDLKRDYTVLPEEWDAAAGRVVLPPGVEPSRKERLELIQAGMEADLKRLRNIADGLACDGGYTVTDIVERFRSAGTVDTVLSYTALLGRELAEAGRHRTARAYGSAARSIVKFNGGRDLLLCEITAPRLRHYERYLLDLGLQMNTVSFYMRNLRAVWNRAVAANIIPATGGNPFVDVFTGVYQTRRRALDQEDINTLASLEKTLPASEESLKAALLYFLFAYHSRGMSFIDLAHLKKADVKGGTMLYKRRKTGFYMEVKVTRPMKKIMDRFKSAVKGSPYVFPILDPESMFPANAYESALNRQNKLLKDLAHRAGIVKTLSTHVARHTWATLAKRMGYSVTLISEGLGHRDTRVTSIYLASFERSAMDEISVRLSKAVRVA